MNVLIVDDVDVNRVLLSEILKNAGYDTVIAEDGLQALALLTTEEVDLVISDLIMPNMDGLRLCSQVRQIEQTKDIPFIICTGSLTTPDDEGLAKEFGADMFLRKPVNIDTLLSSVEKVTNNHLREKLSSHFVSSSVQLTETGDYSVELIQKLEDRNLQLENLVHRQNEELNATFHKLQQLYSMLPICATCKKSRVDEEYWAKVRSFVEHLTGGQFTHGKCDECGKQFEE